MNERIAAVYEAIVERLMSCLTELDQLGNSVAAAHIDAAINALVGDFPASENQSRMDANQSD